MPDARIAELPSTAGLLLFTCGAEDTALRATLSCPQLSSPDTVSSWGQGCPLAGLLSPQLQANSPPGPVTLLFSFQISPKTTAKRE